MRSLGDVGAGHTLGRYELLLPIAQGGMAVVWAARIKGTRGFQKIVAVKSMLPALSEDLQFEAMFLAEAELAAQIRHPNVCEIFDLGEQEGILYLVMEWVDGEPLSAIEKAARSQGGVPMSIAAHIGYHAAIGLHAAHELKNDADELVGLVHRDVSPQNILVTYDGIVKIVDFGVAKATENEQTRTDNGQVKGKIGFMSPEQARGDPIDRRTDIFALGIVLYQALAGKHPFRGETPMVTVGRICDPTPVAPLSTLVAGCPPALDAALARALEKDPAKRFQTMIELARALDRALAELNGAGDDPDLGEFMRRVLTHKAERRRAAIKDALRAADEQAERRRLTAPPPPPSSWTGHLSSSPPASGVTHVPTVLGTGQAGAMDARISNELPATLAPRRRPRTTAVAAVALIAVGAGAGALLFSGRNTEPAGRRPDAVAHAPDPVRVAPAADAEAAEAPSAHASAPSPPVAASAPASAATASTGAPNVLPRGHASTPAPPRTAPAKGRSMPQIRDPGF